MNPIPQAISESKTESPTESFVTGKRVRKKNPKYDDDGTINHHTNPEEQEYQPTAKKTGRPRKKRKLNTKHTTTPTSTISTTAYLSSLETQKKQLQEKQQIIQKGLLDVSQELSQKQEDLGLTATETEKLISEMDPEFQYDVPTDDEDEMEIDIPDVTPILELTPPTISVPTRGTNGRGGFRGRGRARGKKKSTTKRAPPKRKTQPPPPAVASRPKRVVKKNDPDLPAPFKFCRDVLDQLMSHRFGFPFNEPVDPVLLGIPNYPLIIKHPMDFGTIRNKLNGSEYEDSSEFIGDVNLVFNNAYTFNTPESDVYIMASALQQVFNEKIKSLEKHSLESFSTPKPAVTKEQTDSGAFRDLKKSVDTICNEIRVLLGQQSAPSNGTRRSAPKREEKPLTKEEKRRLSFGINSLSSSQLAEVVKIIKEKLPNLLDDKEIVIDIDSLDTATLRSLESYVQSTKRRKTKRKPARRAATALQADPEARLKLAKLTEQGMQSKIESVKRQLEELNSKSGLQSSTNRLTQSVDSVVASVKKEETPNAILSSTITKSLNEISAGVLAVPLSTKSNDDSGSEESESESEESESESEESESETDSNFPGSGKKTTVETVAAPRLSNHSTLKENLVSEHDAPKIIATPNASEVNVDKIENVASWNDLASGNDDDQSASDVKQSEDVTNLWSSFRDSHAQVQQKELEKKQREEQLQKERKEEEQRQIKLVEEQKRLKLEEEEKKKKQQEEEKLRAQQEIEEARLKAKRDRERKVQEAEDNDVVSLNAFGLTGPLLDMNISGQVVSDIRSSLKMTSTEPTVQENDG